MVHFVYGNRYSNTSILRLRGWPKAEVLLSAEIKSRPKVT